MSVDVATLSLKIDSTDVNNATRAMDRATASASGLEGIVKKVGAAFGAALGAAFAAKQLFDTNVEFQRLGASLETVTGSAEAASRAFGMIQGFAKTTPYEVSELTQAFIDLKTRGMDAGMGSMTSYGNMASAFGRSLTDLVRAVSGVAMGESEAIKSFGVQAMTQGDRIALTFKGQTEIVKRTVGDVEDYFKRLSDANFASGMERQAKTLGGVMSNLKDQIANTFFEIGNAGVSGALTQSVLGLTQAIADATPALARFAGSAVSGLASVVSIMDRYKLQIVGVAVVLGTMATAQALVASTTLASGVAFVAQTARTIALTFAVTGYSVSATAAAVATSTWSAASMSGLAAFGLLAVALGALYMATRSLRKEMEEIDKAIANNKPWKDRADFQKSFAEGTKDLENNIKTLRAALGGNKQALDEAGSPSIAAYRRDAAKIGSEAFERQIQLRLDAEKTEKQLKAQLDAKNQATKEAASVQEKLRQQSKAYLETLKEEVATYGMSQLQLDAYKAKKLGLLNSSVFALHQWITAQGIADKMLKVENELLADNVKILLKKKEVSDTVNPFAAYKNATQGLDPLGEDMARLQNSKNALDLYRAPMEAAGLYRRALENVRLAELRLRAEAGETWAIIGDIVTQNAGHATDAMVNWMNNLDGVGRSWKTLGDTVRSVIADMLIQMQRAIIQQQVMSPLLQWAGMAIGSLGPGASTNLGSQGLPSTFLGTGTGGGYNFTTAAPGGFSAPMKAGGGTSISAPISIVIQSDGNTSVQGGNGAESLKKMGEMMAAKCREVMVEESRQGGLMARS